MLVRKKKFETFNSGTISIHKVKNNVIEKTLNTGIRYGKRTIGIKRFSLLNIDSHKIDMLISIPSTFNISYENVISIKNETYRIMQIQPKDDTFPSCIYISLEKEPIKLKFNKEDEN